jgi:hypothetical protein
MNQEGVNSFVAISNVVSLQLTGSIDEKVWQNIVIHRVEAKII